MGKMGQEQSYVDVDENTPPQTLESRTIEAVAKLIKDGKARQIVDMVSAPAQGCRRMLTLGRRVPA